MVSFLVKQIIDIQTLNANQKEIMLINKVNEKFSVKADVPMLNTVLRNLISNALKFTNKGGQIEIGSIEDKESYQVIYVKDNGIGISKENMDKLFKN